MMNRREKVKSTVGGLIWGKWRPTRGCSANNQRAEILTLSIMKIHQIHQDQFIVIQYPDQLNGKKRMMGRAISLSCKLHVRSHSIIIKKQLN